MKKIIIVVSSLLFVSVITAGEKKHAHHEHHHGHDHDKETQQANTQSAHEHGVAKMNLALIGKEIQLELDTPAYNLIGFEHQPKTQEQQAKVKKAEELLADPAQLLAVENNSCVVEHVKVDSPFKHENKHAGHAKYKGEHLGHDHHKDHKKDSKETDSEYSLEYHFVCTSTVFNQVNFSGLFQKFANFTEIRVQWLSSEKQGDAELTSAKPVVTIE